jgi:hypothetical protein
MDELIKGKLVAGPGAKYSISDEPFARSLALHYARLLAVVVDDFEHQLHFDYLPVAEDEVLLFQLCNVAGAGDPKAMAKAGNLGGWSFDYGAEEYKKPHWSLTVFRYRCTWDAEKKQWGERKSSREGEIAVGFREPFHALSKGDDYYFLTDSGRLYRAPKPKEGADRAMECVWDDAKQPITAFLTDANADRSFLFCKPAEEGGKGVYFELSDKPEPRAYDASAVPAAKADDPLPGVRAYAKLLLADGRIKAEK